MLVHCVREMAPPVWPQACPIKAQGTAGLGTRPQWTSPLRPGAGPALGALRNDA